MIRRIPIFSTLVVLGAVAVMIALGLWQLERRDWKEALIKRQAAAVLLSSEASWPAAAKDVDATMFRRATLNCLSAGPSAPMAGHNAEGETGWAQVVECALADGGQAPVVLGWSRDPQPRSWAGGEVRGIIAPGVNNAPRLVADPPLAGLAANARPDPATIPNNHFSYAMQWFFFAGVALMIYALAVRKRLAGADSPG